MSPENGTNLRIADPKISVVMFSYNFEDYIGDAIESVIQQTLTPFEIIICDDCSTDRSWSVISEYARRFPKLIRAFRHQQNIGHIRNGKFGKDQAVGELVSILDGDDRWLPKKLEMEWNALRRCPEARVAYSNVIVTSEDGTPVELWYDGSGDAPPSGDVFVQVFAKRFFPKRRNIFRCQLMFRDAMMTCGYGDEKISVHADWDLKIRLAASYPIVYSGEALVEYRVHDSGIHKTRAKDIFHSAEYVIQKNLHLIKDRTDHEKQYILNNLRSLLVQEYQYSNQGSKNAAHVNKPAATQSEPEYKGENLIFIISQPRAGSTLLQRILGGHPDVHTTAEPWIMLHPLYALKKQGFVTEYEADMARKGLEDFTSQVPEGMALYTKALRQMAHTLYHRILEVSGKKLFIDKTPRYYFIIPELKKIFPNARFIILLRNPLAVLSSTLQTWFQNNPQTLINSNNRVDIVKGPSYLVQGMHALQSEAIIVHYERLVENTGEQVRYICDRCGIAYHQDMLNYGAKPKPWGRFGDSVGIVRHDRAVSDYTEKWIDNLSSVPLLEFAIGYLDQIGADVFRQMGYSYRDNRRIVEELLIQHRINTTGPQSTMDPIERRHPDRRQINDILN